MFLWFLYPGGGVVKSIGGGGIEKSGGGMDKSGGGIDKSGGGGIRNFSPCVLLQSFQAGVAFYID